MKNISGLMIFMLMGVIGGTTPAHAFLQTSMGSFSPHYSPYPAVLSPAIDILPHGFVTINVGNETYYYCDGVFYQMIMRDQKYTVVPPPIGAVVFNIPVGYQYMFINGSSYYVYQGIYYKRVLEGYKVIYPPT